MHRHVHDLTYRSNNVITCAISVVVPLESELVASSNIDGLRGLDTGDIALYALGGDIENRIVVRWRIDVSALLVANSLVLSVHKNIPQLLESDISVCL